MHPMVLTLGWFRYKKGTMLNITGTVYRKRQQLLSYFLALVPVLYTVGLWATFWNMNSSVWAEWAAQGSKEKKWI